MYIIYDFSMLELLDVVPNLIISCTYCNMRIPKVRSDLTFMTMCF
jgi:hypothetical protein